MDASEAWLLVVKVFFGATVSPLGWRSPSVEMALFAPEKLDTAGGDSELVLSKGYIIYMKYDVLCGP